MGKYDFVPEVMAELGVNVLFHKVNQRPGKPFWFGKSESDKIVFALPGNPVSAIICFYRYIVPQLRRSSGEQKFNNRRVILGKDIQFTKAFTYFLPVALEYNENGQIAANPVHITGSGDFGALANSDGFIELDANCDFFEKGTITPFFEYR